LFFFVQTISLPESVGGMNKILKKKLKSVEKSTLNLIDEYHHHGYVLNHGVVMLA
jgi:hypothetical protein